MNTFRRLSPDEESRRRARMTQQMKRQRLEFRWFQKARNAIRNGSPRANQWYDVYTRIFGCGTYSQMLFELIEEMKA